MLSALTSVNSITNMLDGQIWWYHRYIDVYMNSMLWKFHCITSNPKIQHTNIYIYRCTHHLSIYIFKYICRNYRVKNTMLMYYWTKIIKIQNVILQQKGINESSPGAPQLRWGPYRSACVWGPTSPGQLSGICHQNWNSYINKLNTIYQMYQVVI